MQIDMISLKQVENTLIKNQDELTKFFLLWQVYYSNFVAKINQK